MGFAMMFRVVMTCFRCVGGEKAQSVAFAKSDPFSCRLVRTRTRTNTKPNGTEANAAGRSGNTRALRKQSKCGMIQEGEGHWPNSSKNLQKARNLWVLRIPQNNKEEGARAKELVT